MAKAKRRKVKPFVFNKTVKNNVPNALSYPNQTVLCNVGKHKIVVRRHEKLNYYGNPIYTATYVNKDGTAGASYRTTGTCRLAVDGVLKKHGVSVKY